MRPHRAGRSPSLSFPAIRLFLSSVRLLLSFLFATPYSLFASFLSLPLREGHAERRWRLDACDAPRSAGHDRPADASSNEQARAEPALRSLRTTGCPWLRSTCRPSDLQGQWAVRRLASPAIGNARLYGAPRGI